MLWIQYCLALIGVTTSVITANIEKRSVTSQKFKFVKLRKRWKRPLCQKSALQSKLVKRYSTDLLRGPHTNPSKISLDRNVNDPTLFKRNYKASSEHNIAYISTNRLIISKCHIFRLALSGYASQSQNFPNWVSVTSSLLSSIEGRMNRFFSRRNDINHILIVSYP